MRNKIYYTLLLCLLISLIPMSVFSQSREVSIQPYLSAQNNTTYGVAVNYYMPIAKNASMGIKASYTSENWERAIFTPRPHDQSINIALTLRRKVGHRRKSRFFYEYGLLIGHKIVQHPVYHIAYPNFPICGTGISIDDYRTMVDPGHPTYQLQMGFTSAIQYDYRIAKKLFLGVNIGVDVFYNFVEKEKNYVLKPQLSLSYLLEKGKRGIR